VLAFKRKYSTILITLVARRYLRLILGASNMLPLGVTLLTF
jgi:hypothetical protein